MPRPTQFINDVNLQVDQSLGLSRSAAQATERSQADVNQAIQNVVSGMGTAVARNEEYKRRQALINKRITSDQARASAQKASQDAYDSALTNPERAPDGSDLVQNYEEVYTEQKETFLDGLNDDVKGEAAGMFDMVMLQNRGKLLETSRKVHADWAVEQSENVRVAFHQNSRENPDNFAANAETLQIHYNEMFEAGLIDREQARTMSKMAMKENAIAAINGMTQTGDDFDEAVSRVTKGDMAEIFTSEEEKTKMVDLIQRRKMASIDTELKDNALAESRLKKEKKQKQENMFQDIFSMATGAESVEERREVITRAEGAVAGGFMSNQDFNFIKANLEDDTNVDDQELAFDYAFQITGGEDTEQVRSKIKDSVNSGEMKASTGRTLLQRIKGIEDQKKSTSTSFANRRIKAASDKLDAVFGSKSIFDKLDFQGVSTTSKKLLRAEAESTLLDLVEQNPQANPVELADQVIKEYTNNFNKSSVPVVVGVPSEKQKDVQSINQMKQIIGIRFRNHQIKKAEAERIILELEQRARALEAIDAAESQTRGANK